MALLSVELRHDPRNIANDSCGKQVFDLCQKSARSGIAISCNPSALNQSKTWLSFLKSSFYLIMITDYLSGFWTVFLVFQTPYLLGQYLRRLIFSNLSWHLAAEKYLENHIYIGLSTADRGLEKISGSSRVSNIVKVLVWVGHFQDQNSYSSLYGISWCTSTKPTGVWYGMVFWYRYSYFY